MDARTEITTKLLATKATPFPARTKTANCRANLLQQGFEKKFSDNHHVSARRPKTPCAIAQRRDCKSIVLWRQDHAPASPKLNARPWLFPANHSDFAVHVTSVIPDAQQMAVSFANNNLNGHTRFLDGYLSARTRVCVTVGMMTTGYDCEDLLNLALLRPVFSPTDFIQIKGRGTRKFTFRFREGPEKHAQAKEKFKLFDSRQLRILRGKFNYTKPSTPALKPAVRRPVVRLVRRPPPTTPMCRPASPVESRAAYGRD